MSKTQKRLKKVLTFGNVIDTIRSNKTKREFLRMKNNKKNVQVVSLKMVKEKSVQYENTTVKSPTDAYNIFNEFIGSADREHFVVGCVNTKNEIIALNTVSIGTLNQTLVSPREVFKVALLSNAASIIVAHNHPSGNASPSQEDIAVTKRLQEVGELLGVELLDHIIVGDNTYTSLKELSYL